MLYSHPEHTPIRNERCLSGNLLKALYKPAWRNGIRDCLKNNCPYGLEGSNPSTGMIHTMERLQRPTKPLEPFFMSPEISRFRTFSQRVVVKIVVKENRESTLARPVHALEKVSRNSSSKLLSNVSSMLRFSQGFSRRCCQRRLRESSLQANSHV